jgi:hypothetical protein
MVLESGSSTVNDILRLSKFNATGSRSIQNIRQLVELGVPVEEFAALIICIYIYVHDVLLATVNQSSMTTA